MSHFRVGGRPKANDDPLPKLLPPAHAASALSHSSDTILLCGRGSCGTRKLRISRASAGQLSDAKSPVTLSTSTCTHAGSGLLGANSFKNTSDVRMLMGVHGVGS